MKVIAEEFKSKKVNALNASNMFNGRKFLLALSLFLVTNLVSTKGWSQSCWISVEGDYMVCANTVSSFSATAYYDDGNYEACSIAYVEGSENWVDAQGNVHWGSIAGDYRMFFNCSNGCYEDQFWITVSQQEIAYSVTGGGTVCNGSEATINLSGSQTGLDYYLLKNGAYYPVSYNGSLGGPLSWVVSEAGTYTVGATEGCSYWGANGETQTFMMSGSASVNFISPPSILSVQGAGTVCEGGTSSIFMLSSQSGFNYELRRHDGQIVGTLAGTGGQITWSGITSPPGNWTYTVTATNNTCSAAMSGNPSVTVNALPNQYTVSGGGSFCSGTGGLTIALSGSQTGVNYQLQVNGSNIGSAVSGNGGILNWTDRTTPGSYTVIATNAGTNCSRSMIGNATVTENSLPTQYTVGGGGSYCSGGTAPSITVSNSEVGVNYQLKLNGSNTASAVSGTGASLTWTNQLSSGNYTITATRLSTGCTQNMTSSANVNNNPLPVQHTVSGGGSFCSGTGPTITLSGSESGVTYQLKLNGSNNGSTISGNGGALNWTDRATVGTYTVIATNVGTSCSQSMNGSATVTTGSLPTQYTISGGGAYCSGSVAPAITLSNSQFGVNYQLKVNGDNTGTAVAGTGATLSWTNQTSGGTYSAVATDATTGCAQNMLGTATITVNALPIIYTVGGGGTFCTDNDAPITFSGSEIGVNYQLSSSGIIDGSIVPVVAGTGAPLNNWKISRGTHTLQIIATNAVTGCSQTMSGTPTIIVNRLPSAFSVSGGGTSCSGSLYSSVSLQTSQTGINYQLKVNGTDVGSPKNGGAPLTWGDLATGGIYTIVATDPTTGCSKVMTGSAEIVNVPLPSVFTLQGTNYICPSVGSTSITLSGSEQSVTYRLLLNGAMQATKIGTGSPLIFNTTTPGTYEILSWKTDYGQCQQMMSGTATVVNGVEPTIFNITGGGIVCSAQESQSGSIQLSGSQVDYGYQLLVNGINTGSIMNGTGSALSWTGLRAAGIYSVLATSLVTGCEKLMNGTASITVINPPTPFEVLGGETFCEGDFNSATIHLSGSQAGYLYQLFRDEIPVGAPQQSRYWPQDQAGIYTITAASSNISGCSGSMHGSATITKNPLPISYPLFGGGEICSGYEGIPVGLSNSQIGVDYRLISWFEISEFVPGNGGPITWENQFESDYFIEAINPVTGCGQQMEGSVTIVPSVPYFTVSGGGSICEGASGKSIKLNGSSVGIDYQLQLNEINLGPPVLGTGSALTWANQTNGGTYTVKATNTLTACTIQMDGSAQIIVNLTPQQFTVAGGGGYCLGNSVVPITLSGSETGIRYQLKVGTSDIGSPISGNGSILTWPSNTNIGTYTIVATRNSGACVATMTGNAVITQNELPLSFTFTGVSGVCLGESGVIFNLNSSQVGVNYQLQRLFSTPVGLPVAGTGEPLNWSGITMSGTYRVSATIASTGCTRTMSGARSLSVYQPPTLREVLGGGNYCPGGPGLPIMTNGSEGNVSYQLKVNDVDTGPPQVGNGDDVIWPNQTTIGVYTIVAKKITGGCTSTMPGSATIATQSLPQVAGPNSIGNSPITLSTNESAHTYAWQRDGDIIQGQTSSSIQVSEAGEYHVTVTTPDCSVTSAGHFVNSTSKPYFNGIITSIRWRTDKPFLVTGDEYSGMYNYHYDEKYQIKEAQWATPNFATNTFSVEGNKFRLSAMSYDPNGNIKTLRRFDDAGTRTNNFTYNYDPDKNTLRDVSGYTNNSNLNNHGYKYNAIGQLINQDLLAGSDQYVEYDVTGKVLKVFSDSLKTQLKVEFLYDDLGFRLAKKNIETRKTTWYIRDAGGNILSIYEEDTAENTLSQTEVPIYGAGKLGTYYPNQDNFVNYELTDHLGNVRALVRDEGFGETATMETVRENKEEGKFLRYKDVRKVNATLFDHTHRVDPAVATRYAIRLSGSQNEKIGLAKSFAVAPGDHIEAGVYAKYLDPATNNVDLTTLISQIVGGTAAQGIVVDGPGYSTNGSTPFPYAGILTDNTTSLGPKAYLNWIVFDRNVVPILSKSGFRRMTDIAKEGGTDVAHEYLSTVIDITEPGYIYIYLSNDEETPVEVYFDDFTVSHTGSYVSQATDFGVWGEVLREEKSPMDTAYQYKFGYQGQYAEKDEETGWNHFELREYDPVIGRWLVPDPAKQYPSPYVAFGNNPVNRIDEDGGIDGPVPDKFAKGDCKCSYVNDIGERITELGFSDYAMMRDIFHEAYFGSSGLGRLANADAWKDMGLTMLGFGGLPDDPYLTIATVPEWLSPSGGGVKALKGAYTVYKGIKDGKIVYWGITKNLVKRIQQHGDRFQVVPVFENLSKSVARGIEQIKIETHGLKKLDNIINSVGIKNPKLQQYYKDAISYFKTLTP